MFKVQQKLPCSAELVFFIINYTAIYVVYATKVCDFILVSYDSRYKIVLLAEDSIEAFNFVLYNRASKRISLKKCN